MNSSADLARFVAPDDAESGDWSVYLVLCGNGSLYCGISTQPQRRFAEHASGKGAKYMRIHKPVAMRVVRAGISRSQALKAEMRLKKLTGAHKRALWDGLENVQTA